jgi:hypothetical protein
MRSTFHVSFCLHRAAHRPDVLREARVSHEVAKNPGFRLKMRLFTSLSVTRF